MDQKIKTVAYFALRVLLYALLMFLLNVAFFHDALTITSTGKFGENSWTEILQETFLFSLGILMLFISRHDNALKPVAVPMSLFFFMAFIREFNNQIPWWFYLEIPLLLILAYFLYRFGKYLVNSIYDLVNRRAISWLVIGFLVTFVFSRLFGRTSFWEQLLEADYNRWAKNAAEEGIELLGYALMFIGGVEMLVDAIRGKRRRSEGIDLLCRS
jgi:hypothetical protein